MGLFFKKIKINLSNIYKHTLQTLLEWNWTPLIVCPLYFCLGTSWPILGDDCRFWATVIIIFINQASSERACQEFSDHGLRVVRGSDTLHHLTIHKNLPGEEELLRNPLSREQGKNIISAVTSYSYPIPK